MLRGNRVTDLELLADRARIAAKAIVLSGGELRADIVLEAAGLEHHPSKPFFLAAAQDAIRPIPPPVEPGTCTVCARRIKWADREPATPGFKTCARHRRLQRETMRRHRKRRAAAANRKG